ncbi:hypothetical protein OVA07_00270 [Novosphingobium sp. SL115]|uniref:hypothetical protein n=1 Tax=Novosphingobium sp. SL115 TaxID=2995150 RepID=UPI002273C7F8|nr:hypothetical protein [Novosphingobium sp. SL115]MCY1669458.1 hypothetical protein [Novosphingobium sp. SL115]
MQAFDQTQLADLTVLLRRLSDTMPPGDFAAIRHESEARSPLLLDLVRAEQANRKRRAQLLGIDHDIFSDPAWDILLELFEADLGGQKINASVVGLDANIPQSTALRWLNMLEKVGLVRRRKDEFDKRRQWIGLTVTARAALQKYFQR